jgi:class 3 adenylate cyclase
VSYLERLGTFARVIMFDKRGTGLSDPVHDVATLEERMDDVRAVMDAAGSQRAALLGFSEGGPMSILFAATYPDRVSALILYGSMARSTYAPDYPFAPTKEAVIEAYAAMAEVPVEDYEEVFAPSLAGDPTVREWFGRNMRAGASPSMLRKIVLMFLETDVRSALKSVRAPTLVLHRHGDRVVNRRAGEHLAREIDGARYVDLPGNDHTMYAGDTGPLLDEIELFLTGALPVRPVDRILSTVLFTDIVDSTARASALGDSRWRALIEQHDAAVRRSIEAHRGRAIKTMGDGFLATFDGPGRAIRCACDIKNSVRALGLEIRSGLHTGEIELMADDVGGIAVTIAARIAALGGAGDVLCSRTVKDLVVGSGLLFDPRGVHVLKGIPDEWPVFAVKEG